MAPPFSVFVILGVVLFITAVRLACLPFRRAWDWWLSLALVFATTAIVQHTHGTLSGALAGLTAYAVLLTLPQVLARRASQRVARGDFAVGRALASCARALHPLGETAQLKALFSLAARLTQGEVLDLVAELSALGFSPGIERSVTAVSLLAWGGDFAGLSPWLQDPALRRELVRRGHAALLLAADGESEGTDAVLRGWYEVTAVDRSLGGFAPTASTMLVAAAHLGAVSLCHALARELTQELTPARRAYWLATSEQRAGDVVSAHETLAAAVDAPGITQADRARTEWRMMHPLAPVTVPPSPEVLALTETLRLRVAARRDLALLGFASARPARVTIALGVALAVMFVIEVVYGLNTNANETLYRLGGLPVPLPSLAAAPRLFTYGMLHAGYAHVVMNLLTLAFFGRFVERRLGGLRMLSVYLVAGLLGGIAALAASPASTLLVGASGSIFGLVGAATGQILSDRSLRATPEGRSHLALLGGLLVLQALGDAATPHVSSLAHVGGMLTGLTAGLLLRRA